MNRISGVPRSKARGASRLFHSFGGSGKVTKKLRPSSRECLSSSCRRLIEPDWLRDIEALIGTDWRPCSEALRPVQPTLPGVRTRYFFERYNLQVFRREGDTVRLAQSRYGTQLTNKVRKSTR